MSELMPPPAFNGLPGCQCLWCGAAYGPRRDGGSRKRFCSGLCRAAFHRAARRWAIQELERGRLTVEALRKGSG